MLTEVNPLPGSGGEPALADRNAELHAKQAGFHVRGHIIGPFIGMLEVRRVVRHQTTEECLEITAHQRVGVLRALAADPPLMLMDEPLGALDRKLTGSVRMNDAQDPYPTFQAPRVGDALFFGSDGPDLITSPILAIERPSKEVVEGYPL